jgi:hypothetical protein
MPVVQDDVIDEPILEGIVVTQDAAGQVNIAPMGPRVDRAISHLLLRPFQSALTFANLRHSRAGVFHVTDDIELLARAAVGRLERLPPLATIAGFPCPRLADSCRWFAFHVEAIDDASERASVRCRVIQQGDQRPFFGFNRAKHAVLEAAILATRVGILPVETIEQEMKRLAPLVEKTAGAQERRAFAFLEEYIASHAIRPHDE